MADMMAKVINHCKKWIFVILGAVMFLFCSGMSHPDTILGLLSFQMMYHFLGPERALPLYQGSLALGEGRSLPDDSDRFLVRQLFDGARSQDEKDAILDFYLERAQYGASSYMVVHKREMTRQLMSRFETYSPAKKLAALILLQDLATGHKLDEFELGPLVKAALPQASSMLSAWQLKQSQKRFADFHPDGEL